MLNARKISCLLCGFLAIGASSALAVPITFYYGGTIDSIHGITSDLDGLVTTFNEAQELGKPELGRFSGHYTFDSEALNVSEYQGDGRYESQLGLTLTVGKIQIEATSPFYIWVLNREFGDGYDIEVDAGTMSDGFVLGPFKPMRFSYDDSNTFSSDALPIEPPPISPPVPLRGVLGHFQIRAGGPSGSFLITGTVEYLVPEPNTLWLFAAGVLAIKRRFRAVD